MTTEHSPDIESSEGPEPRFTLATVFPVIWKKRFSILLFSLVVGAVTLGINFLLPLYYKTSAKLLPETEKTKLSGLGQFAEIAQLAGVGAGGADLGRLYPAIITSETILRRVINRRFASVQHADSVNLIEFMELDEDTPEQNVALCISKITELLSVVFDNRTGIVTITLEMKEPALAADVVNAMLSELDQFLRRTKLSNASEQRKWIESRLKEVERELRSAEDGLRDFREKNRRVMDSPQLLVEQERRLREVQVKSTIYIELMKQYELAKIEEIKNIPIVNVLDPARPPVRKERPKRATNAVIAFLLTFLGTSTYLVVRSVYGEQLQDLSAKMRGRA